MDGVRLLLNVIWFVLVGWWLALMYLLAGLIACLLIVTIPFGRTTVPAPGAGAASAIGNVLWFLFAGWWLALAHIAAGIGFFVTIIGIRFGVALFELAIVGLFPLGKRVVDSDPLSPYLRAGTTVGAARVREVSRRRRARSTRTPRWAGGEPVGPCRTAATPGG
jgi:uncharacterized membrane protein YccF (DUF307 family)